MDRNCPVLKKHMEIARVVAFDNLPFFETRLLVEKNINSLRVTLVKSLRNFLCLPDMDFTAHETQRSYLELADNFPSYKSMLSSSNNGRHQEGPVEYYRSDLNGQGCGNTIRAKN